MRKYPITITIRLKTLHNATINASREDFSKALEAATSEINTELDAELDAMTYTANPTTAFPIVLSTVSTSSPKIARANLLLL